MSDAVSALVLMIGTVLWIWGPDGTYMDFLRYSAGLLLVILAFVIQFRMWNRR